jgi:hypothetical protein
MSENRGVPAKPPKPPRRRTYLGNGCEFDGADSSTLALLAAPRHDGPGPVPRKAAERTKTEIFFASHNWTGYE